MPHHYDDRYFLEQSNLSLSEYSDISVLSQEPRSKPILSSDRVNYIKDDRGVSEWLVKHSLKKIYSCIRERILEKGSFTDDQINQYFTDPKNQDFIYKTLARSGQKGARLDLSNCDLKYLPAQLFKLFPNIIELDLSNNKFKTLPENIGCFPKLRLLNLANNDFEEFPTSICQLSLLEGLSLTANRLQTISDNIGCLQRLRSIDLSNNKFVRFPDSLRFLPRLQELILTNNSIITLPDKFGRPNWLHRLQRLYLGQNQLRFLPEGIYKLELRVLHLDRNPLYGAHFCDKHKKRLERPEFYQLMSPEEINEWREKERLDLIQCLCYSKLVPFDIGAFKKLKDLDISYSALLIDLNKIPNTVTKLSLNGCSELREGEIFPLPQGLEPEELNLRGCELISMPILSYRNVRILNTTGNRLGHIRSFKALESLEEYYGSASLREVWPEFSNRVRIVDLSNNPELLPPDRFEPNSFLTTLNISRVFSVQSIRELPTLASFPNLQKLFVKNVGLEFFPKGLTGKIEELDLLNNPIRDLLSVNFDQFPKLKVFKTSVSLDKIPQSLWRSRSIEQVQVVESLFHRNKEGFQLKIHGGCSFPSGLDQLSFLTRADICFYRASHKDFERLRYTSLKVLCLFRVHIDEEDAELMPFWMLPNSIEKLYICDSAVSKLDFSYPSLKQIFAIQIAQLNSKCSSVWSSIVWEYCYWNQEQNCLTQEGTILFEKYKRDTNLTVVKERLWQLNLAQNAIQKIPSELPTVLPALKYLELERNPVNKVPQTFIETGIKVGLGSIQEKAFRGLASRGILAEESSLNPCFFTHYSESKGN